MIRRGRRVQLRWGGNVWFRGADGERQAVRIDSRDTHDAYSVIEIRCLARLRCPDAPSPQRGRALSRDLRSLPNCHWRPDSRCTARNSCDGPSKHAAQLAKYRRGGKPAAGDPQPFEQIVYAVKATPPEKIRDLATAFGCDILGPPVRRMRAQRFMDSTISDS